MTTPQTMRHQGANRKKPNKARAALAGLILSAGLLPSSAWACCDDFWSCGLAFVSGGLSCAIQEAQRESQRILNETRAARDRARARYDEAVNGTNTKKQETIDQAQAKSQESVQAVNGAQERVQAVLNSPRMQITALRNALPAEALAQPAAAGIAGRAVITGAGSGGSGGSGGSSASGGVVVTAPPQSGSAVVVTAPSTGAGARVSAIPRPPSPEEVRQALENAARTLDNLRQKASERDLPVVSRNIARMNDEIGRAIGNLNGLAHRLVFGPLEEVLSVLGRADPTGLTTLLAASITALDGAMYALETELFRAIEGMDDLMVGLMGEVENAVSEVVADSELARQIEAAVNNLNSTPTQGELTALNRLLPAEPARPLTVAAIRGLSGATQSARVLRIAPTQTKSIAASMKSDVSGFAQLVRDPVYKAKFQPKSDVTQYLNGSRRFADGQFAGLDAAGKQLKKQQLMDEARRRFSGQDPAKLREFERLLTDAAGPAPSNLAVVPGPAISVPPPVGAAIAAPVGGGLPPPPSAGALPSAALPAAAVLPALPGGAAKPIAVPPPVGAAGLGAAPALGGAALPGAAAAKVPAPTLPALTQPAALPATAPATIATTPIVIAPAALPTAPIGGPAIAPAIKPAIGAASAPIQLPTRPLVMPGPIR